MTKRFSFPRKYRNLLKELSTNSQGVAIMHKQGEDAANVWAHKVVKRRKWTTQEKTRGSTSVDLFFSPCGKFMIKYSYIALFGGKLPKAVMIPTLFSQKQDMNHSYKWVL